MSNTALCSRNRRSQNQPSSRPAANWELLSLPPALRPAVSYLDATSDIAEDAFLSVIPHFSQEAFPSILALFEKLKLVTVAFTREAPGPFVSELIPIRRAVDAVGAVKIQLAGNGVLDRNNLALMGATIRPCLESLLISSKNRLGHCKGLRMGCLILHVPAMVESRWKWVESSTETQESVRNNMYKRATNLDVLSEVKNYA
jgi:hypothetical protein